MKFGSLGVATILALIAPTFSQELASLPECAQTPILEAATATGCSLSDLVCICGDGGIVETLMGLIPTLCTPEEVLLVSEFGDSFCLTYASITLSLSDAITNLPSPTSAGDLPATATSNSAPASASVETTGASASASATEAAAATTVTSEDAAATTGGAHSNVVGLQALLGAAGLGIAAVL